MPVKRTNRRCAVWPISWRMGRKKLNSIDLSLWFSSSVIRIQLDTCPCRVGNVEWLADDSRWRQLLPGMIACIVSATLLHGELVLATLSLQRNNVIIVIWSRIYFFIIASPSHRVSLIVIPFCLCVCWSFRDLQPTTIDRSEPNLVGRYIHRVP